MPVRLLLTGAALLAAGCAAGTPARPLRPLASLISGDDYPTGLERRQEGRVAFTLAVGPDGRVAACRVTESSGSAGLDQAACRLMRTRARFAPARDRRGAPVAGTWAAAILWRLPEP